MFSDVWIQLDSNLIFLINPYGITAILWCQYFWKYQKDDRNENDSNLYFCLLVHFLYLNCQDNISRYWISKVNEKVARKVCVWRQPNSYFCALDVPVCLHYPLNLTARRYNLVGVTRRKHRVLIPVPRASGARKLSRCKEGMAHFLPSRYKVCWVLRVSRYKLVRSQKFITSYNLGFEHWRGRGISH